MTQARLLKHLQFCKFRYNGYGEEVFQEACLIALQRYKTLDNVNQSLFSRICKEAARTLLRHRKYEITFSQLQSYEDDEEKNFEDTLADLRTDALDNLLNDLRFEKNHEDVHDKNLVSLVSFSNKEQLTPFQLTLPLHLLQSKTSHINHEGGATWTWRGTPTPYPSQKSSKG